MKTINSNIRKINDIRKLLNAIEREIDHVSNVRSFNELDAQKSIALIDLEDACESLYKYVKTVRAEHSDAMSLEAHKQSTALWFERGLKSMPNEIVIS